MNLFKALFTNILLFSILSFLTAQSLSNSIASYGKCEKVYIHTDRNYYTAGGDIFFKSYVTNEVLSLQAAASKVLYVDLIDEQQHIVDSKIISIANGIGQGDFKLSSRLTSGKYLIRAYTAFMKNNDPVFFFRKAIYINGITKTSDDEKDKKPIAKNQIFFFPEGGDLLLGLPSRVAIKTVDPNGLGTATKGKIINQLQEEVIPFSTNEYGFGVFKFTPQAKFQYFAVIENAGTTIKAELPSASSE
ncbi:MAG: hypothetical protein AAFO82_24275, partial [Bacteroidota bacterium]